MRVPPVGGPSSQNYSVNDDSDLKAALNKINAILSGDPTVNTQQKLDDIKSALQTITDHFVKKYGVYDDKTLQCIKVYSAFKELSDDFNADGKTLPQLKDMFNQFKGISDLSDWATMVYYEP